MSIQNATPTVAEFIAENADTPMSVMFDLGVEMGFSLMELRQAAVDFVMGPIDLGMVGA